MIKFSMFCKKTKYKHFQGRPQVKFIELARKRLHTLTSSIAIIKQPKQKKKTKKRPGSPTSRIYRTCAELTSLDILLVILYEVFGTLSWYAALSVPLLVGGPVPLLLLSWWSYSSFDWCCCCIDITWLWSSSSSSLTSPISDVELELFLDNFLFYLNI